MLMDIFYDELPFDRKTRVHFYEFMQSLHIQIHKLRKEHGSEYDYKSDLYTNLINKSWIICFDELQVTDIANAMILRGCFDEILSRGGVMVITSNRHPKGKFEMN